MIPKKMHFTFSTEKLPEIIKENLYKWRKKHPDWEFHFYTDKQVYEFFFKYFPQYFNELSKIPLGVILSDVFRYGVIYIHGGLYSDVDTFPIKKIPEEWLTYECILGYEYQPSKFPQTFRSKRGLKDFICQWTLLGSPKYPLYRTALEESFLRLRRNNYQVKDCEEVLNTSGPFLITDLANPYLKKSEVLLLDADYFACSESRTLAFTDRSIVCHQFHGEQIQKGYEGWVIKMLSEKKGICPFWKWKVFSSSK